MQYFERIISTFLLGLPELAILDRKNSNCQQKHTISLEAVDFCVLFMIQRTHKQKINNIWEKLTKHASIQYKFVLLLHSFRLKVSEVK